MVINLQNILNKGYNKNIILPKVFHQGRLIIGSGEEIYEKSVIMTLTDGTKVIETFDDGKIPDYYYQNNSEIKEIKITEGIDYLGFRAFYECGNIEKVELPSTLVNIGKYNINGQYYQSAAFWNCTSLTTVIFNKDTRVIGQDCFYGCTALTNITLNEGLERIESNVFYNCDSLSSITIPNSVTYIGSLNRCKNLSFIDFGSTRTDVPTIHELRDAFEGDYRLSEIRMSDAMYDIMYNWTSTDNFKWKQLYSSPSHPTRHDTVNIYGSIQGINTPFWRKEVFSDGIVPQDEFRNNSGISSVFIDSGITEIESIAFYNCVNMSMVTLSSSVKVMGTNAFGSCVRLEDVNLSEGLETIGKSAFYNCTSLSSITIPNSVTSVGQSAFGMYDPSNLEIIDFGNSRTTVPTLNGSSEGFCPTSARILVPDAIYNQWVTAEGWSDIASQIYSEEMFRNKYIDVTIGGNTSRRVYSSGDIEENAFRSNTGLINVVMYSGITSILDRAFANCKNLTSVTFSQNIDYVGDFAFSTCGNLTTIDMSNCTNLLDLHGYTFIDCHKLSAVTLPPNITHIGSQTFAYCTSLSNITLPNSVRSIESNVFYFSGLLSIELSSGLTRLGNYCFYSSKISSIEIPSGVTQIPQYCFAKCSSLSSVTLHEGTTTIGQYAFRDCNALTNINIPNTVRRIDAQAFMNCKGLTSIIIPNNVSQIYSNTFSGCTNLALIDFGNTRSTIPTLQNVNAFNGLPNNYEIVVPDALVDRWKTTRNWSSISSHIIGYTDYYGFD